MFAFDGEFVFNQVKSFSRSRVVEPFELVVFFTSDEVYVAVQKRRTAKRGVIDQ